MANENIPVRKGGEGRGLFRRRHRHPQVMTPFEEMERMMEGMLPGGWPRGWGMSPFEDFPGDGRMPRVDVQDRDDQVLITAEMPGVKKDDLEISLGDSTVTLRGRRHEEEEEEGEEGQFQRREILHAEFSRTLPLPAEVNADKARARLEDGMLTLTLPKAEGSKRRTITVE